MHTIITGIATTLLVVFSAATVGAETRWTHLFTKDGIGVYMKDSPGKQVCAFKGVGLIDAGMETVASVIQDIPAYKQWVPRCRETRLIKEANGNTSVFYSVVNSPLPYKDRDMILVNKTIINQEEKMIEISFDLSEQDLVSPQDNYVRVKELSGRYLLEHMAGGKTRITFVYRGNPGGNIPLRIANWYGSRKYAHANIMGLRKMAENRKNIDACRRFEENSMVGMVNNTTKHENRSWPSIRMEQASHTY